MPSRMRAISAGGRRSRSWSQCSSTHVPGQGPAGPVGHDLRDQEGAVLGADLVPEGQIEGAGQQGRVPGGGQGEQVAHLVLGGGGRSVLVQDRVPALLAAPGRHHVGDRASAGREPARTGRPRNARKRAKRGLAERRDRFRAGRGRRGPARGRCPSAAISPGRGSHPRRAQDRPATRRTNSCEGGPVVSIGGDEIESRRAPPTAAHTSGSSSSPRASTTPTHWSRVVVPDTTAGPVVDDERHALQRVAHRGQAGPGQATPTGRGRSGPGRSPRPRR